MGRFFESEIFFKFHYLTSSGGQVFTEDLIRTMFRTFHKPEFIGHPEKGKDGIIPAIDLQGFLLLLVSDSGNKNLHEKWKPP